MVLLLSSLWISLSLSLWVLWLPLLRTLLVWQIDLKILQSDINEKKELINLGKLTYAMIMDKNKKGKSTSGNSKLYTHNRID